MGTDSGSVAQAERDRESKNLSRQFQFLFRRELRVETLKRFRFPLRDKISVGRRVFAADAVQVSRNQLLAQEKRRVRAFRQSVITNAERAGAGKAALSIEVNIPLKAQRRTAELRRLFQRIVQQKFPLTPPLAFRRDANRTHCHNGDFSAAVGFDLGTHKDVLSNQDAFLLHNEIQL